MQKLVTEVRRFRSDQGLADRQKVPARLAGVDRRRPGRPGSRGDGAGLADRCRRGFQPDRAASRCGCRAAPSSSSSTRRAPSTSRPNGAGWRRISPPRRRNWPAPTAKLDNEAFLAKAPADVVDKIRGRQQVAREEVDRITRAPGCAGMTKPLTGDIGRRPRPTRSPSLLQVEHLLDQRWPETKLEPSTARISALMELLGSPQRSYPSIHIAGTNGKTSVARMVDALLTALQPAHRAHHQPAPAVGGRAHRHRRRADHPGALRRDLPRDRAVRADGRRSSPASWPAARR